MTRRPVDAASLVRVRRERGLSMRMLAALSGVHIGSVEWAEKAALATDETVARIAAALGVEPNSLRPVLP